MENSEFDKFIKSNTHQELDVPEGLDWENMNIPLPPPEKKNRKIIFMLWFGLLFFAAGSMIYFYAKNANQNEAIALDKSEKTSSILETETIEKIVAQDFSNKLTPAISGDSVQITNTAQIPFSQKKDNQKGLNQLTNSTTNTLIIKDSVKVKTFVSNILNQANLTEVPLAAISKNEINQLNIASIQSINALLQFSFEKKRELNIPTYFVASEKTPNPKKKKKKNGLSVTFSFGLNTFNQNYQAGPQAELLKSAEESAIGNSYNLGLEYHIKKGFFTSVGVSYQRLHRTFTFSEELETEINYPAFQKTYRTKRVFYNNYFDFIELNIGGEKSFSFGKNWGSQLALNINPSFKIKSTGRTLDDNESIIDIEDFATKPKVFVSAGAEVRLFYKINSNRVFTSFGYKQALSKIKLLNNSSLSFQPQVLSVTLGVSRDF